MNKDRIQEYTLKITQASRTELIVVLYDLAMEYLDDSIKAYDNDEHELFRENSNNAMNVVRDLIGALDFQYELAMPLYRIYEFVNKEISLSVIKNNTQGILDSKRLLSSLKESFESVSKQDSTGPVMGNTQSVYAGLTYGKGVLNESISTDNNRGYKV